MRNLTAVLVLAWAFSSFAQTSDAKCELARPVDGQRLLRRLSLDLRGSVPSYAEHLDQRSKPEVATSKVEAYLASPDFTQTMRKYHQQLLWPNLDAAEVDPLQNRLFPFDIGGGQIAYFSVLRALFLRSVTQQFPPCRNAPLEFNTDGSIKTYPLMVNGVTVARQEGYVMVEPYWAPGTQVKVCGFDAQAATTGRMCQASVVAQSPYMAQTCQQFGTFATAVGVPFTDAPIACDSAFGFLSAECGCGPNLRLCHAQVPSPDPMRPELGFDTAMMLRQALIDQQMKIVEEVISQDLPYTEVLLRKRVQVNGLIAHYMTWQSRESFNLFGETDATTPIPASLTWLDRNTWVDVDRTGRHAGILTTPGYLLKYQSNRGRAHRYYNAFECSSFIPSGALPSPQEACSKHENLTLRCGCDSCHVRLEPMASKWGRFAEYGMSPLSEARYPKTGTTVCSNFQSLDQLFRCFRFYNVQPVGEEDTPENRGLLKPYVFRTPEEVADLEIGPAALVQKSIDSGTFASCTTRKMWGYYMRREPTPDEESTVIPKLAADFKNGGYHLKGLVKAIVTQPAYGRMP